MKKNLFLITVAALAFAACTNETTEYVGDTSPASREIAFSPLTQAQTRTSTTNKLAIEGTTFPQGIDMMVTAYEQSSSRVFFGATNFKYNYAGGSSATSGYWGAETNAKYWPLSPAYINFLAVANANSGNASGITWGTNKADQVTVVMTDNYGVTSDQRDFMYAIGHGEVTQSGNALTFPDNVPMTFKHAQAYMIFRLKAADAASCGIKIKDITIYGAHFAGTAVITHTNYNSTSGQATTLYWNPVTQTNADKSVLTTQTAAADEASSTALTQSLVQMGQIMVVPHMSAADTYDAGAWTSFKITYYLNGNEYSYTYTPTTTTLEAGKKYIYDITFQLHEIFIQPTVEPWQEGSTTIVDIPTVVATSGAGSGAAYNISCLAKHYNAQAAGFSGTETVTYALTTDGSIFATAPTSAAAVSGVYSYNFVTSANTAANAAVRTNVYTLTGAAGNKTTVTLNQYPGVAASETFKVAANTAATYTFQVYGLTPSAAYTLAEGTDTDNIMTVDNAGSINTDIDGVATVKVTMTSDTNKSATLKLTDASSNVSTVTVTIPEL